MHPHIEDHVTRNNLILYVEIFSPFLFALIFMSFGFTFTGTVPLTLQTDAQRSKVIHATETNTDS
jgi:hypothetical protein